MTGQGVSSHISSTRLSVARVVTRASYLTLVAALLVGGIKSGTAPLLVIIAVAPLTLFAPGVLRDNPRTLILLCFVALFYFTVIVANLFEPDRTIYDAVAVTVVTILFVAAMMLSRWLQRRAVEPTIVATATIDSSTIDSTACDSNTVDSNAVDTPASHKGLSDE